MEIIDSFILGLLQGLTEFLPISSSGHLVLGQHLLGTQNNQSLTFEIVVHFGTLCSILVYYSSRISDIISSLWELTLNPGELSSKMATDDNIKLSGFILLSMIPAMIVGFTMEDVIENVLNTPFFVSIMLLVTGCILFATKFQSKLDNKLTSSSAINIGLAQAFAILPGVSRSGSTISMGLYLGIEREKVANFSFLMVIPVIAGITLVKVVELINQGISVDAFLALAVGFVTSFISGYFALKYLIIFLQTKGIHPFAWYCWAVGLFGLTYVWLF